MPKLRDQRPVGADFATGGPNATTLVQAVDVASSDLFAVLAHGPSWKEWLGIDVEWTSPEPFGVGTTRTIRRGPMVADETFLVWEDGSRMGFRFDRCSIPFKAFAEDYEIKSTGPSSCELHWHYAFEFGSPLAPVLSRVFGAGFKRSSIRALSKLAKVAEPRT